MQVILNFTLYLIRFVKVTMICSFQLLIKYANDCDSDHHLYFVFRKFGIKSFGRVVL